MSSIPREALKTRASKPGVIGVPSSSAQGFGAGDDFLGIGDVGGGDLVHHLGRGVAQHALGADVEDLDDALGVGGDAGEVGAVEDRALQGARLEQRLFAPDFGDDLQRDGVAVEDGFFLHCRVIHPISA